MATTLITPRAWVTEDALHLHAFTVDAFLLLSNFLFIFNWTFYIELLNQPAIQFPMIQSYQPTSKVCHQIHIQRLASQPEARTPLLRWFFVGSIIAWWFSAWC